MSEDDLQLVLMAAGLSQLAPSLPPAGGHMGGEATEGRECVQDEGAWAAAMPDWGVEERGREDAAWATSDTETEAIDPLKKKKGRGGAGGCERERLPCASGRLRELYSMHPLHRHHLLVDCLLLELAHVSLWMRQAVRGAAVVSGGGQARRSRGYVCSAKADRCCAGLCARVVISAGTSGARVRGNRVCPPRHAHPSPSWDTPMHSGSREGRCKRQYRHCRPTNTGTPKTPYPSCVA